MHYKRSPGGAFGAEQGKSGSRGPKPGFQALSVNAFRRRIGELQALRIEGKLLESIRKERKFSPLETEFLALLARRDNREPEEIVREIRRRELLKNKKFLKVTDLPQKLAGFVSRMISVYLQETPWEHGDQQEMQDRFVRENFDRDLDKLHEAVHTNSGGWRTIAIFKEMFRTALGKEFREEWVQKPKPRA